jgi:hypothetical protein
MGILSINTPFDISNNAQAAVIIDIHLGGALLTLKVVFVIVLVFRKRLVEYFFTVPPLIYPGEYTKEYIYYCKNGNDNMTPSHKGGGYMLIDIVSEPCEE